jgi:hypothetical protein
VQFYRVSGLSVASEIALPGLIAGTAERAPQVTIRRGPVPENLPDKSASGSTWQIAGKQFLLRIPDIARFLLKAGKEIVVEPESEETVADIPIFILGTVFGILLHQREQIVLHASAVRVAGKAIVFCGGSGAGKSTLAAALAQRGYPLVTDDFCTVSINGAGAPLVYPDGRQLKLWAQAIDRLDLAQSRGERVRKSWRNSTSNRPTSSPSRFRSAPSMRCAKRGRRASRGSRNRMRSMPRSCCGVTPTGPCWCAALASGRIIFTPQRLSPIPPASSF